MNVLILIIIIICFLYLRKSHERFASSVPDTYTKWTPKKTSTLMTYCDSRRTKCITY